jgi:hypothetical protein
MNKQRKVEIAKRFESELLRLDEKAKVGKTEPEDEFIEALRVFDKEEKSNLWDCVDGTCEHPDSECPFLSYQKGEIFLIQLPYFLE